MNTLEMVLRILLVVDALALIGLVLLQQGRGASMGAAFGSGASSTVFGSAGASSFMTKLTAWLAVAFFAITFGLAWTARERAEAAGMVAVPDPAAVEERSAPEVPAEPQPAETAPTEGDVPSAPDGGGGGSDDVPQP